MFGICFIRSFFKEKTVIQFGFASKMEALRVIDKSWKHIDPACEDLILFEYPADRADELTIDEALPPFAIPEYE